MNNNTLENEWLLLQNQFDSYEKFSLLIKLFSIAVFGINFWLNQFSIFVIFLLLILWLQDAIWKTFQARIEARLLKVETAIAEKSDALPCQFNSEYLKHRLGSIALIGEYLKQSLRPTIAFPHTALIILSVFQLN